MLKNKETSVTFILWFALLISSLMYILIDYLIMNKNSNFASQPIPENYKIILMIFSFMSLLMGIFSISARKLFVKEKFYTKYFKDVKSAKKIYFITIILSSALAETIATFGFILFIMGKNIKIQIAFTFVSIIIMLVNKPSLQEYKNLKKDIEENENNQENSF